MTHQIVIVRHPDGYLRFLEMGAGETTTEHEFKDISDKMATEYLYAKILERLVAVKGEGQ